MKIKDKDSKILNSLRHGDDVNKVAQEFKIPKSTVYYHLNKLKKAGFIKGMRVAMNYEQTSNHGSAIMLVSLNKTNAKDVKVFEDEMQKSALISDLYAVTGDWDFVLILRGNKEELTTFIMDSVQAMPNVNRTHSLFVMRHTEL